MKVRTLKRAAGAVCFDANQVIDLPDELVPSFVEAGAVEVVECGTESTSTVQSEDDQAKCIAEEPAAEPERQKRKRR